MGDFTTLLTRLWRGGAFGYFWRLHDKQSTWFPTDRIPGAPAGARDLYFGVHPVAAPKGAYERGKIEDVAAINCLFAEFDGKDFGGKDAAADYVARLIPRPSVVVDSGGGFHCYWLLADTFYLHDAASRERAERLQKAWVTYTGGDPGAADLARVLRVPGTLNTKYDPPREVRFVHADFQCVYELSELEALAGDTLPVRGNGHKQEEPPAHNDGKIRQGTRNVTLFKLGCAMRRRGATPENIETTLLLENAARCDPPLDEAEVLRIAKSAAGYVPAPDEDGANLQKDYGHATFLSRLFVNRYRWAVHLGKWLEYADGVWRPVPEERVARVASETLRAEYAKLLTVANGKDEIGRLMQAIKDTCYYARMTGALAFLKGWDGILTYPHEWDANPWLLNVANGTVDLRTLELRPHDPADMLTKQAPVRYDPQARSAKWEAHVNRFLPNPNIRRQVQRDLGLALVGATMEEALPIWFGQGANGKSTTARTVMGVLGDYAIRAAPNLLVQTRHEEHPTGVADLAGRRLVFSVEVDDGKRLAEALVKDLTGGDRKKARHMRQDFFEFEQTFSIFMLTNHKPIITGTDEAIWRRIRLTPWEYRIPEHERRPQDEVVAELVAEGSAVLNWLLEGLADWLHDHHWVAPEVQAATEQYRLEQDILGGFLGECCELGPRFTVAVGALYERYTSWCNEAGEEPVSKTKFGNLLRQRGIGQTQIGVERTRKWVGIRLKKEGEQI